MPGGTQVFPVPAAMIPGNHDEEHREAGQQADHEREHFLESNVFGF